MKPAWRTLAVYGAWNALMQFEWLRFAPLTDAVAAHWQVTPAAVGGLSLLFPLLFVLLALPSGWLIDRLGVRATLRLAALLMTFGAAVRISLPAFSALLAGQTLFALAQPLIMALLSRLVLVWFTPEQQLAATGVGTASLFIGIAAAFILVPLTVDRLAASLEWDLWLLVILLIATLLVVPRDPRSVEPENTRWLKQVGTLLRSRTIQALLVLIFLGNGYFNAVFTWLEPLLAPRGIDAAHAGYVGLLMLAGGLIGMGLLSSAPSLLARLDRLVAVAALLGLPLTAALIGLHSVNALYASALLLGFAMLAPLPLLVDRTTQTAGPALAGTALSLFWLSGNAGAAAAIAALSPIADRGAWALGGTLLGALLVLEVPVALRGLRS